jgi:hypothetical protein
MSLNWKSSRSGSQAEVVVQFSSHREKEILSHFLSVVFYLGIWVSYLNFQEALFFIEEIHAKPDRLGGK